MNKFKKYLSIFLRFRQMNFMVMLEYRADFIFWGLISGMWSFFHFFFINLLATSTGFIADWSKKEVYVLMSVFTIYDAFTWSFFYQNMQRYMNSVFTGELDGFLVKPVDPQFMLSVEKNSYNNLIRLFIGVAMLIYSLFQLEQTVTIFSVIVFIIEFMLGLLLTYAIWYFIATFSFWVDRLSNLNDILPSLRRLSSFPRSVYTGISSLIFCVALPVVLITSIPTETLINKVSPIWTTYFIIFSVAMFWISRRFFFFSVKRYSGAGS